MLATAAHTGAAIGGGLMLGLLLCGVVIWLCLLRQYLHTGLPAPPHITFLQQRHWSVLDLLYVGVWVSTVILVFSMLGVLARRFDLDGNWLHTMAALQNTILQLLVGVVLVLRMRAADRGIRESFAAAVRVGQTWGRVLGQTGKWYVLLLPLVLVAAMVSQLLFSPPDQEHTFQPVLVFFTDAATPGWFRWWIVGVAVIIAPIVEEALFRGVMLPVLLRKYGVWTSLIGCSLLFALVHGHLPSMLPLFVLSMGLGAAYVYTGNLCVPIGIHAVFNGVSLLVLVLAGFPSPV